MKTRGWIVKILAVALSLAPQLVNTSSGASPYSAQLLSPAAGEILYPGRKVRVEWRTELPRIDLTGCEMEVWLSLDGGATFPMCITPLLDPKAQYFYWIVPNMPTTKAVLDIRFGCDGWYPESYAPQSASTFVIADSRDPLQPAGR